MSLDPKKLAMVREVTGGAMQARCPACAEAGADRKGEHLRIYPDGRYGCCVHPKDREHRKRIYALAGDTRPRQPAMVNCGEAHLMGGQKPASFASLER